MENQRQSAPNPDPGPLMLDARPYCVTGEPCSKGTEYKRYFHAPAHVANGATGLITKIARLNQIQKAAYAGVKDLWSDLENAAIPALSAGAMQIRKSGMKGLDAKAYFKPIRMEGAGIKAAAVILARAASKIEPGAADYIRKEVQRRDRFHELFYLSAALRPGLEIETYFDCEGKAEPFSAQMVRDIATHAFGNPHLAGRAAEIARAVADRGFPCEHVSCDLWPADSHELSMTLSVDAMLKQEIRENGGNRSHHLKLIQDLTAMRGSKTPVPACAADITMFPCLQPSVITIKLATDGSHRVFNEEIDPKVPIFM